MTHDTQKQRSMRLSRPDSDRSSKSPNSLTPFSYLAIGKLTVAKKPGLERLDVDDRDYGRLRIINCPTCCQQGNYSMDGMAGEIYPASHLVVARLRRGAHVTIYAGSNDHRRTLYHFIAAIARCHRRLSIFWRGSWLQSESGSSRRTNIYYGDPVIPYLSPGTSHVWASE